MNCLASVASRRSSDLTFAAAVQGEDVDPEVAVVCRRAVDLRLFIAKNEHIQEMTDEILQPYRNKGEPGCYTEEKDPKEKELAGEPTSPERARLRRQCKPQGPVGFPLESLRLQAAALDMDYSIHQWNQPVIMLQHAPFQLIAPSSGRCAQGTGPEAQPGKERRRRI